MQQPADFLTLTENYVNFATSFIKTNAGKKKQKFQHLQANPSLNLLL